MINTISSKATQKGGKSGGRGNVKGSSKGGIYITPKIFHQGHH